MAIGVTSIKQCKAYLLTLEFDNGEERIMNMEPLLNKGKFQELKDPSIFCSARVSFDTIEWSNGVDICPEFLYEHSKPVTTTVSG